MTDSTPVAEETQAPTIGRHVIFRSRTGDFDIPAIVTATEDSVDPEGVDKGNVPQLSGNRCVHLTVFTPQKPGTGTADDDVNPHGASENVTGEASIY